jgi:hypothetical protein
MRLYREFLQKVGLYEGFCPERCVWLVGGGGYLQGVKSVVDFSSEKITVSLKAGWIEVEGRMLSIGKFEAGDLEILGEIERITYQKRGK